MNRKDEYLELKREMDELSAPGESVARAMARQQREKREKREKWGRFFLKPLGGLAAACALFVLLVNLSPAVARACEGIPLLGDLAEAVRFSRSLSEAVEHEYYKKVDQQQTIDGVTVSVDYLIADKKGVTIFYHICETADLNLEDLDLVPELSLPEVAYTSEYMRGVYGTEQSGSSYRIYFHEDQTPQSLPLKLKLYDVCGPQVSDPDVNPWIEMEPEPLKTFTFMLELDQDSIVQGRHYEVDQIMEMDGQKIHITGIDIYPTLTSISIESEAGNTAWLYQLDFYLLTEDGTRYEPNPGLLATGNGASQECSEYYADSVFFSSAEKLTLYVTGARWLSKDKDPEAASKLWNSGDYSQFEHSQYDVPVTVEFDLKK